MSFSAAGVQVASLYAKLGADVSDFNSAMKRADSVFGKTSAAVGAFARVGVGAALAGIGALGAGFGVATKQGMAFEKIMSGAGAVLQANNETMQRLSALALQIGKDTAFSASEAASAIEMLAKNGLSAEQILGGAANATVALAAATGADLATAADVATDAMAQFGMTTGQLDAAINGIAGVVVSSKFGINDYALALAQAGGVAGKLGVDFEDFNAVIAATSSSFSSGSDAGTSFKTFLQRLPGISGPARDAMAELGILTEDGSNQFFDAAGNMKSMAEIAGILQQSLAGLSDETKTRLLSDIFGTDAIRTALGLAGAGTEGINALLGQIGGVDAGAQAMQRLDNLAGDVEQFSGSLETLGITVQKAFNPMQRRAVQFFTGQINKLIDWDWDAVALRVERVFAIFDNPGARRTLTDLVNSVRSFGETAVGALAPVVGAFGALWAQVAVLSGQGVGAWLGALRSGWGEVLAWAQGTALPWLWDAVMAWGGALWGWVAPQVPKLLGALETWGSAFAGWAGALWVNVVQPKMGELWASISGWVTDPTKREALGTWLAERWTGFQDWAAALWADEVKPKLTELWSGLLAWVADPTRKQDLKDKVDEAWTGFQDWAKGLWGELRPDLEKVGGELRGWVKENAPGLSTWVDRFVAFTDDVAANWRLRWPEIVERLSKARENITGDLDEIAAAFDRILGGGGEVEGSFGKFMVNAGAAFVGVWTVIAERFMESIKNMILMIEQLVVAVKALGRGDWAAAWAAAQEAGSLFGQAVTSSFWELPMELIDVYKQFAEQMGWFGGAAAPGGGGGGFGGADDLGRSAAMGGGSPTINVTVNGSVPQDRTAIQELARAIWREVELSGGRI